LDITVIGICKLGHGHAAHEFGNTRDKTLLVKAKVFECICEPFLKLANTMFN
jgi:hypothetical protein